MFLHTLAAQYPENPTAGQERDAKDLIGILTRMYPCDTCAHHFADVVSRHPPDVSTGLAFQRWLCAAHNEVILRLEKEQIDPCKVPPSIIVTETEQECWFAGG